MRGGRDSRQEYSSGSNLLRSRLGFVAMSAGRGLEPLSSSEEKEEEDRSVMVI